VLGALIWIIGDITLPRPVLNELTGYPSDIDIGLMRLITESLLWWLLFVFLFWVVALFCVGFSADLLLRSLRPQAPMQWRVGFAILFITAICAVAFLATADRPLVSMVNLLKPMHLVSAHLIALAERTNSVGIVAVIAMIASGSLMLMPGRDAEEVTRKIRCSTQLLYAGAALMLVWIVQATAMYRFAATLVEENQRRAIWELAPTVAMILGAIVSLSLAIIYLSSIAWLNSHFATVAGVKRPAAGGKTGAHGAMAFLQSYWGQTTAVLTPMVPGFLQLVSIALKQQV
jgi:hypothetical protein